MAVKSVCFKVACKHELFANSSSMSNFKSPVILLFDLSNTVSHRDVSPLSIWTPQILRLSFILGGQVAQHLPVQCGWFSLSFARNVSLDVWHWARLSKNCLPPQSLLIFCRFWGILRYGTETVTFLNL